MEEKDLRKYAQLMREMDLPGLEINENGAHVRLERAASAPAAVQVSVPAAPAAPAAPAQPEPSAEDPDVFCVRSPMVGVFYAAPSQEAAPYVAIGDRVQPGDTLCIIEAMKLMNELTCECAGIVEEICVGNNQTVDFGHVLFRIRSLPAANTSCAATSGFCRGIFQAIRWCRA